jgi:predicted nucleic acid-binding protein
LALAGWEELEKSGPRLFTSDLVVAEALRAIYWSSGVHWAARAGRRILSTSEIQILRPGPAEELGAIALMEKFADQRIGFVDCVSFVLMRQRRLNSVFSFDKHFEIAGFKLWPRER